MHNKGRIGRYVLIQNPEGTFPSKPFDYFLGRTNNTKVMKYKCSIIGPDAKIEVSGELAYMGMPNQVQAI